MDDRTIIRAVLSGLLGMTYYFTMRQRVEGAPDNVWERRFSLAFMIVGFSAAIIGIALRLFSN